jgi:hypothetical protein
MTSLHPGAVQSLLLLTPLMNPLDQNLQSDPKTLTPNPGPRAPYTPLNPKAAVFQVLVPLLVDAAAPEGGPPTPVLRDMALRLVNALPSAPAGGAAFRAAVAALPAASKARLQAALREAAAAGAAGGAGAGAGAGAAAQRVAAAQPAKPAIQLKMSFALPKPS